MNGDYLAGGKLRLYIRKQHILSSFVTHNLTKLHQTDC